MFQYLLPGPHLYFEMVFVQLFFIAIIMKNMILLGSPFVFVVVTNDFSYPKIVPLPFLFSFPSLIKYHHSTNTVLLLLPLFNWSSSLKNCDKPFGKKAYQKCRFKNTNKVFCFQYDDSIETLLRETCFTTPRREVPCATQSTVCLWKALWKHCEKRKTNCLNGTAMN